MLQQEESAFGSETGSECEQSSVTTIDAGVALLASYMESVVALDTGSTANLVCFSWLAHHNSISEKHGLTKVSTYLSKARFRFGDGSLG